MIHQPEYVKALLKKHIERSATPSEIEILLVAMDLYDEEEITQMLNEIDPEIDFAKFRSGKFETAPYQELKDRINKGSWARMRTMFKRILPNAAAYIGILAILGAILWLIFKPTHLHYYCGGLPDNSEIPPGVNECRLTLSNNCTILIDSDYTGLVAREGNMEIIKLKSGILEYRRLPSRLKDDTTSRMYNTISTPGGTQYRVILPDGSMVRLNAASSIRFPVEFSDTIRNVEVEGEAFFEVAANPGIPFIARLKNAEIRVTGTSFNVNTYSQNTIATLVSGSLQIKSGKSLVTLKPGEQAIINNNQSGGMDSIVTVSQADTDQVISWKKVKRVYSNIESREFVQDIGRWYGLEIVNIECVPHGYFSGSFCYDMPLAEVLELFRANGLRFRVEGKRIVFCREESK
jgi:transmembrane sensor